jgi:Protein of unknown function (DUF3553)
MPVAWFAASGPVNLFYKVLGRTEELRMPLKPGQFVRHPICPEWGIGKILGEEDEVVRVFFPLVGEKTLKLGFVELEVTEDMPAEVESGRFTVRAGLDIKRLEALCNQFHEEMKDNRSNTNDGRMALNVLTDIKLRNMLSSDTRRQLLSWCHTDGSVFRRGVDLAQQICREVYGRIPARNES